MLFRSVSYEKASFFYKEKRWKQSCILMGIYYNKRNNDVVLKEGCRIKGMNEGYVMKKGLLLLVCLFCLGGCAKKEDSMSGEMVTTPLLTQTPESTEMELPTEIPEPTVTPPPTISPTPTPFPADEGVHVYAPGYEVENQWYADEEAFLQKFGFADAEPTYEYYDTEGNLQFVLYCDESIHDGVGIRYTQRDPEKYTTPKMDGFRFWGRESQEWEGWKMDYTLTEPWEDGDMEGVEEYEEHVVYDENGRMTHFEALGEITWLEESEGLEMILKMDFTYYENGNLKQREYFHSPYLFSTTRGSLDSYFDARGRLVFEKGYITHGSLEDYYIYEDADLLPDYGIFLDISGGIIYPTIVRYEHEVVEAEGNIDAATMTHEGIPVAESQDGWGTKEVWYPDEASFLETYGFGDSEPFYCYYDEAGKEQMKLYYNEEAQFGLGIGYYQRDPSDISTSGMYGFTFEGIEEEAWEGWDTDYSATTAWNGRDGKSDVDAYEESIEYDANGRMTHFESQGIINWLGGEEENTTVSQLLWIDCVYYNNGNLKYRYYWHNSMVFSSTCATQRSYFDKQGRLLYEYEYLTHGNWDEYYIYLDEDEIPEYCLSLDHCWYWYPTFIQYEG